MSNHFENTRYGFNWGGARLSRGFSDEQKGWVTLLLETDKYVGQKAIQIYITKTGKVRVHSVDGEWTPPRT